MANISVTINEQNSQNSFDSYQLRPRAVIAIFPFKIRPIYPYVVIEPTQAYDFKDYLDLRNNVIIIADDILAMDIGTGKGAPNHTLQAQLAPTSGDIEFIQACAPGDHVMAWIVNGTTALEDLINKLKNLEPANQYESGLKFYGQVMEIQESFRVGQTGVKNTRYNLVASGFNQYNAQIYYSPFLTPKDSTNEAAFLFPKLFYKTIGDNVIQKIYSKEEGGPLSIQKQLKFMHKLLLGPGPGPTASNSPIKSVNGAFSVPKQVAKVFGRSGGSQDPTFADLASVILGLQTSGGDGPLGPNFKLDDSDINSNGDTFGCYWEPKQESDYLKGRKALRVSPTMGGTIYSLLQQVSNPAINEMYFTLRPDPSGNGNILPTMVCRQLPFITKVVDSLNNFNYTKFFDLPRFIIPKEIIMGYEISRSDALRLNATMVRQDASQGKPGLQGVVDSVAIQYGNWAFDTSDIKRNGMRFYPVKVDQDLIALDDKKASEVIRSYTAFISSIISNQHLKYNGVIQTFGIFDPICVGENLEFNNIVFHIEGVKHVYQVQNGLPIFRTTLSISHGIHKSGDLEALQDKENYKQFSDMRSGIIKEGTYKTIFVKASGNAGTTDTTGGSFETTEGNSGNFGGLV
jgi:hypothetical protein